MTFLSFTTDMSTLAENDILSTKSGHFREP